MSETADVVVIGGGVMGVSIAFHLAQRRAGKIVLLEKSHLGAASSGKSGAIIRQYYSHELLAAMAGLVFGMLGRAPEIGDRVSVDGLALEVEEVEGSRILKLQVEFVDEPPRDRTEAA